jgi:polysaccharide pyruvyl transferase WcaK-like protein
LSILDADIAAETAAGKLHAIVSDSTGRLSFALVTPYTGGNLGDGAIQEAMIWNIRSRFPNAAIYGITLKPADTAERHGIPSYPISWFSRPQYTVMSPSRAASSSTDRAQPTASAGLRSKVGKCLASVPIHVARFLLPRGWPWFIRSEMSHVVKGFAFLKHVDFVIFSGGGQIDDYWGGAWGHPYALLKWAVLARLRGASPIYLSVGFCSLGSRLGRLFTRTSLCLSAYRSYRDAGSRELMGQAGFRRNDPVYPDLAYSYPTERLRFSGTRSGEARVAGLSPFCYCDPRVWPRKDGVVYAAYLQKLVAIVRSLTAMGWRVSLFASDECDRLAIADLWELLSREFLPGALALVEKYEVKTVDEFLEQASRVDVMVASRLHGVLLAQLAGTPVIALSYDRKVDVQMESVGHRAFCLAVDSFEHSEFQDCFGRLQADLQAAREQLKTRFADGRAQLEVQYDTTLRPAARPYRRGGHHV